MTAKPHVPPRLWFPAHRVAEVVLDGRGDADATRIMARMLAVTAAGFAAALSRRARARGADAQVEADDVLAEAGRCAAILGADQDWFCAAVLAGEGLKARRLRARVLGARLEQQAPNGQGGK